MIFADVVTTWNFDGLLESALDRQELSEITLPESMAPELLGRYERARENAVKEFGLLRSEDLARAIHYSLTRSEARYLENSPDAHTIRDRLVAAGLESRALLSDAAGEPLDKSESAGDSEPPERT